MIERLPRYAEVQLQVLCAEAGALCHAVDEDESGWDRFIEFPARPFVGPLDARPPNAGAYIQVKSTTKKQPTVRVKLSNALRAAQSPHPWFIVVVAQPHPQAVPKVYAVHVWEILIRDTLKAVRRAEVAHRPIHKCSLTISLQPEDERSVGLIDWMHNTIEEVRPEYEAAKRAINRSVGYENGYGMGLLTIEASSEEEILRNFLGIGHGLRLTEFRFTPQRFGIPWPTPQIEAAAGIVHISPLPSAEIEVRLSSSASSLKLSLRGHAYTSGIPDLPRDKRVIRFSASFVEILWRPSGETDFQFSFDPDKKSALSEIEKFALTYEWMDAGPVEMQVWIEGTRAVSGLLQRKETSIQGDWKALTSALRLLRSIAGHEHVNVSLIDLSLASGLRTFAQIAEASSMRVTLTALQSISFEELAQPLSTILYWFHVDVADITFYAIHERSIVEDVFIDSTRRLTAGKPRCLESYILGSPSDHSMIERDYVRRLEQLRELGSPFDLGNLREMLRSLPNETSLK